MFENVTRGMPVIGAEELYLGGAHVVIGLADERGNLVGYFGREYHPARRTPIDQIGGDEPPIGRPRLAIGLAIGAEETVIGWFGSKAIKAVGTAIVKVAAPVIKSPVTKALAGGLAVAFPPIGVPAAAGVAAASIALPYAQRATASASITAKVIPKGTTAKPAAKPAAPSAAQLAAMRKASAAKATATAAAAAKPAAVFDAAAYNRAMAAASQAASKASVTSSAAMQRKAAEDRRKSAIAAKAQADAKAKAALALATADKVLAAAKGTLPAQKQAPAPVAKALQTVAKKTVAATYAAAKTGDPDAKRGMAAIQIANRVQKVIPATRAAIQPAVAPVVGTTYQAIHVSKTGLKSLGRWRCSGSATAAGKGTGTIVLGDGTPIEGTYQQVG